MGSEMCIRDRWNPVQFNYVMCEQHGDGIFDSDINICVREDVREGDGPGGVREIEKLNIFKYTDLNNPKKKTKI